LFTFRSYKILSLSTISTPSPLDDLKECNEYPWKTEDDEESINKYFFFLGKKIRIDRDGWEIEDGEESDEDY
jgi:hypothetical protein